MTSRFTQWAQHAYRRRCILAAIVIFCVAGSTYISFTAAPTWKSEALLSPSKGFQDPGNALSSLTQRLGGAATLFGVSNAGNDEERLAAIISSRGFAEDLLKRGLLQQMYPKRWDAQRKTWKGPAPSLETAFEKFDLLRSVSVDRQTGLIKVGIIAGSPQQARAWLWNLIDSLNESERERALATAETNLIYLQSSLNTETNKDLRDGLLGIVQSQLATRMLARANKNFAVEVVDRPYLPESRNSPKRKLLLFEGGLIGLVLAFLFLSVERAYPVLRASVKIMVKNSRDKERAV